MSTVGFRDLANRLMSAGTPAERAEILKATHHLFLRAFPQRQLQSQRPKRKKASWCTWVRHEARRFSPFPRIT